MSSIGATCGQVTGRLHQKKNHNASGDPLIPGLVQEMVILEDPSLCMAATEHAEAVLISNA